MLSSLLFAFSASLTPSELCPQFSGTDCRNCLGSIGNYSCGYCLETKECIPGDIEGPFSGLCTTWITSNSTKELNQKCKDESSLALPMPARIGVAVFSSLVIVFTLVFWIWIFPKCFANPLTTSNTKSVAM